MKVVAKSENGFLIEASEAEIKEILRSVLGEAPKDINIGQKVPAIDYASTIRKIKMLAENDYFKNLLYYQDKLNTYVGEFKGIVDAAKSIEL